MDFGIWAFTYFKGLQVGVDAAGNRYFTERRPGRGRVPARRWVIYRAAPDPSSVPAEWHAWLHDAANEPLAGVPGHDRQEAHLASAAGTAPAGRPAGCDDAHGKGAAGGGENEYQAPADQPVAGKKMVTADSWPAAHFTLVRHRAYAVAANPAFEDAVEPCELRLQQVYIVRAAGGLIFNSWEAAQAGADAANYPNGSKSGDACVSGHFSSLRVAGSDIYVPRQVNAASVRKPDLPAGI